jgi:putative transposase
MTDKYKNRYRISSTRLQNWDYGWNGAYFITICTDNRINYFGDIYNGKMQLSNIGVIANILWYEIKNHGKNIELGEFIVMPNHIHGILILNHYNDAGTKTINPNGNDNDNDNDNVETRHALSLQLLGPYHSQRK